MGLNNHSKALVLSDIIKEYSIKDPNRNAVSDSKNRYSFGEVENMSSNLAQLMVDEYGIQKGDRVVFIAEKACEIVIGVIATWKAGAIFVPVDTKNGLNRTKYILDTTSPTMVISTAGLLDKFAPVIENISTVSYESIAALDGTQNNFNTEVGLVEDDIAIILHTSGSTGNPKGVILEHKSVIAYFHAENALIHCSEESRNVNYGPYHFDVSIQGTFLFLYFGASVHIYSSFFISKLVINMMIKEKATHLIAISSVLALITGEGNEIERLKDSNLKCVVTGGENCDVKLINKWVETLPNLDFYNGYGPSECNSLCMAYQIKTPDYERSRLYPIGTCFPGSKAILVDPDLKVLEGPNKIGTLCIGGPQLLRGYWNLPKETKRALITVDGERYYVTGDLAQRDEEGEYYFEGRNDTEVKILGRRINLNEIRNCVLKNENIDYSVIDTIDLESGTAIYAYAYQSESREKVDPEALVEEMRESLPEYMIPKYLFVTNQLIRTSTTKINEREIKEAIEAEILKNENVKYAVLKKLAPRISKAS